MLARDLGIDLGTASVLVYVKRRGIVVKEPSVVAIDRDNGRVLAVGESARAMIGRTPGNIVALRPMREGVIADYEITQIMLRHFIQKVCGRRRFFRPRVVVCVPSAVTSVERRAVLDAATEAGASKVYLVSEPLAAAVGAGLNIADPRGNMVVDIGGGTTDIAVMSMGGEVVSDSLRVGGDQFDDAIARFIKREHNLLIGERTAEEIKRDVGTALPPEAFGETKSRPVRGRDMVSGLPRTITFSSEEAYAALQESVTAIVDAVRAVLEKTPPELSADLVEDGVFLTGGGALLDGLPEVLANAIGMPVRLAESPTECVAKGTGVLLDTIDKLREDVVLAAR